MYLLQAVTLTTTKVILAVAHYFVRESITAFFIFETLIWLCYYNFLICCYLKMNCILYSGLVAKYNQISQINVDTTAHCPNTTFVIHLLIQLSIKSLTRQCC